MEKKKTVAYRRANQPMKTILLVKDCRPRVERGIKKIKMEALLAGKQALRHTPYHCVFGNMTHFFPGSSLRRLVGGDEGEGRAA